MRIIRCKAAFGTSSPTIMPVSLTRDAHARHMVEKTGADAKVNRANATEARRNSNPHIEHRPSLFICRTCCPRPATRKRCLDSGVIASGKIFVSRSHLRCHQKRSRFMVIEITVVALAHDSHPSSVKQTITSVMIGESPPLHQKQLFR